ncbi:uncharacterized protein LOC141908675 [Tubulanus polymorphus]|uniref:uncharacterized protein LOC141908675 n=1 Tax=Tubulanus polymorphus TaxID=672921 RepID=UPI003DA54E3C
MTTDVITAKDLTKTMKPPKQVKFPKFGDAAGNTIAREWRLINMDSTGLIPRSAKSRDDYYARNGLPKKYLSLYEVDFNSRYWDRSDLYRGVPTIVAKTSRSDAEEAQERIKHMRRLLSDPMASRVRPKMFMNWKVPSRLVDDQEPIPEPPKEKEIAVKPSTAMSQKSQLPDIHNSKPASPEKPQSPVKPSSPIKPTSPRKNASRESTKLKPTSPRKDSLLDDKKKEVIRRVINPAMWQTAENMLKNASSCERRVIEKALLAAARGENYDQALGKTVLPDAKQTVSKWLEDASEEDRDVALKFFTSLGGVQFLGIDTEVKKQRLQEVLEALENGKPNGVSQPKSKREKPQGGARVFRNIQLVSPNDKKNRDMYTTWHHLPKYKTANVQNTSSHYTNPQKIISRHFTIHPDWGV